MKILIWLHINKWWNWIGSDFGSPTTEAVILALYAAETKAQAGKPLLVLVPDLSQPSLYYAPRNKPHSQTSIPRTRIQNHGDQALYRLRETDPVQLLPKRLKEIDPTKPCIGSCINSSPPSGPSRLNRRLISSWLMASTLSRYGSKATSKPSLCYRTQKISTKERRFWNPKEIIKLKKLEKRFVKKKNKRFWKDLSWLEETGRKKKVPHDFDVDDDVKMSFSPVPKAKISFLPMF